jgi:gliding motility-associated-like protein
MDARIKTFLAVFIVFGFVQLYGQSYNMGSARRVIGCNLNIYDSGGPNGNYGTNRNDTITIFSNQPANHFVKITIQAFDISTDDTLYIYNDSTANPAQLVSIGSLNVNWLNNSNSIIVGDWSFTANITNPSGAVTLRFKSNGSNQGSGFQITTSCSVACQTVNSRLDSILTTPPIHTEADGFRYIDVCPGQQVHFAGYCNYPINNLSYHQEDDSTTFVWRLSDTTYSGRGLTEFSHHFMEGRGYDISIQAFDHHGCASSTSDYVRVRTSKSPIAIVHPLPDICSGTPFSINIGEELSSDVVITPVTSIQQSSLSFDSIMFVPDGPNCDQAPYNLPECYNTFVTFTSFLPGQVVSNASDILSVCFTMEHSFLGDLQFKVVCPNNQSVVTHAQPNGGSLYLGVPVDDTGGCSADPASRGVGWNYCWSNYPGYTYHGSSPNYLHLGQTTRCDSSNRANHTNFYHPMNSFAGLVGCPLNGTWSIEICDLFGIDDGWIFQWQLNLDPSLLPTPWSYTVGIDTVIWNDSFIGNTSDTSAIGIAPSSGTYNWEFTIIDDFGCQFDSTLHVTVVQTPENHLGNDTAFCTNQIITLTAGLPATSYLWSTGENTQQISATQSDTYWVRTTNNNGNISCVDVDTIHINMFPQPVVSYVANNFNCSPLNAQFNDHSTPTIVNWEWTFGDGTVSSLQNPSHMYISSGQYTTSLTVSSSDGCVASKTDSNYITVFINPVADFEASTYHTTVLEPEVLFTDLSSNATHWTWNFGDAGSSVDTVSAQNPIHSFTGVGTYRVLLTAYSENGCIDTITKFVNVEDVYFFWIPNSFTPDKNGTNEVFQPVGYAFDPSYYSMEIFDRWGKLLFQTNDYYEGWNGKFNNSGDLLQSGDYIYIIKVKDMIHKLHRYYGNVTIIR